MLLGLDVFGLSEVTTTSNFLEAIDYATLEAGEQDAEQVLACLAKLGIDLGRITEKLLGNGITAFKHSLDKLLASLKEKRKVLYESHAAAAGRIRSALVA